MGVASVILGFGLQGILADLFATVSIYTDAPFEIGDTIMVGTDTGKVLRIGMKSTSLQSVNGPELIIANKDIISARVSNISRAHQRRIALTIAVK